MRMTEKLFWTCLLALACVLPSEVLARDLSKYPCSVFSHVVCFRLPTGVEVKYSVPADFDIYYFFKGSQTFASIYIGRAPQPAASEPVRVVKTREGSLSIHRQLRDGIELMEFYIVPSARRADTIHISASAAPATLLELVELLSSVRPCKSLRAGGQRCVKTDVWSSELVGSLDVIP